MQESENTTATEDSHVECVEHIFKSAVVSDDSYSNITVAIIS